MVDSGAAVPRDLATRPEIAAALQGRVATGVRYSNTLRTNLLYVAEPVASGGVVHGAVRITYPTSTVDARVTRYWLMLAAIAGLVLALAVLVGLVLARSVTRPLHALEQAAGEAGGGDLSVRAPEAGPPEVRSLAASFNEMVEEARGARRRAGDLRRRRLAPAPHAPHRAAAAARERRRGGSAARGRAAVAARGRAARARPRRGGSRPSPSSSPPRSRTGSTRSRRSPTSAVSTSSRAWTGGRSSARTGSARRWTTCSQTRSPSLRDGTAVTVSGGPAALHVEDHGPGMSTEERARAFDRFWSKGSGSGLGLPIVKRLIELDGGSVELRDAPGGGLDVVLRLRSVP